ncbi:PH domain-containing protein [Pontixanthobacter gangjinensis]|nr:PH domain-containing protein [Pontixanthobacter gangjinensis]
MGETEGHQELEDARLGVPLRTNPLSFAANAVASLQNAIFPMVAVFFTMNDKPWAIFAALGIGLAIAVISTAASYLSWRRLTYIVGQEDIRVESGILSRAARSVPYERIQDVSLEQKLIPRIFGLVQVKFETGAGGGDDLSLTYLSEAEGERLREAIKAHKDGAVQIDGEQAAEEPAAEVLFAMDEKRLLKFGFFEFSLAAFAVIAGLFQYAETFASIELWNADLWAGLLGESGSWVSGLGFGAQIAGVFTGLIAFAVVGSISGLVRTFLRDWGFVLERTEKGFRRRRGLLTKTDVVMPAHRVQALKMSTGIFRRRFGYYGLKFVSLAQDRGSASHDVAPFGTLQELYPIASVAGFAIEPSQGTDWQRGSRQYRIDSAIIVLTIFAIIAIGVGSVFYVSGAVSPLWALLLLGAGCLLAMQQMFMWRFDFNAIDRSHFFVRRGWLSPRLDVASRIKLQSVELAQGPIARKRGYASLRLGLAGGMLNFEGLPVDRAHELRSQILTSLAGTDFSELAS